MFFGIAIGIGNLNTFVDSFVPHILLHSWLGVATSLLEKSLALFLAKPIEMCQCVTSLFNFLE